MKNRNHPTGVYKVSNTSTVVNRKAIFIYDLQRLLALLVTLSNRSNTILFTGWWWWLFQNRLLFLARRQSSPPLIISDFEWPQIAVYTGRRPNRTIRPIHWLPHTPHVADHHNGVPPNANEQPKQRIYIQRREVFFRLFFPVSHLPPYRYHTGLTIFCNYAKLTRNATVSYFFFYFFNIENPNWVSYLMIRADFVTALRTVLHIRL